MLKSYLAEGNDVVLISDMYLPKETIQKMLAKADPLLATLPLFLSSDKGYQKTTRKLFLEVYSSLDYHYSEWIHIGDNKFADDTQPSRLSIQTCWVETADNFLDVTSTTTNNSTNSINIRIFNIIGIH